jgi:hypothetical protein
LNLPADYLSAPDGKIVACKCGVDADDPWDVDELLGLAGLGGLSIGTKRFSQR